MRHADALAGELRLVTKGDLSNRRGHAVTQLIGEFKRQAPILTEDAIELYDVALRWLVADLEEAALKELSDQLADIPNAPYGTIRILAFHDNIDVAGPVLERSPRLEAGDLIAIIGAKGQEHILFVAKRSDLTEVVTDRLITVGSANVLQALAANGRAPLSPNGSAILVSRANSDRRLADALADRFNLPETARGRLLDDAAAILRAHLTLTAKGVAPQAIEAALTKGMAVAAARVSPPPSAPASRQGLRDLSHEHRYLDLLRQRQLRDALRIVADRAMLEQDRVFAIFSGEDLDLMAIVLRAADMSWAAAEETLAARAAGLDRGVLNEMLRNKFHMMSQRDAALRVRADRKPHTADPARF